MQPFWIGALAIAALAAVFALQNATSVTVVFLLWRLEGSLGLILLLTFFAGIAVALLALIPGLVKKREPPRRE